ncbi:lytic transglycosylase domain-containing protein, partial [Microbacterium sp.]|uniref:aggregation-promoting factor C-terminal-like domain-containing protein n=1 Tax=Microbacterium sp. TaxID=51671 RepID=UPI003A8437C5
MPASTLIPRTPLRRERRRPRPLHRLGVALAVGVALAGSAGPAYAATAANLATQAPTFDAAASDTVVALDTAAQVLARAQVAQTEAALSGLDLGDAASTIDTSDVRAGMKDLSEIDLVPTVAIPEKTEDLIVATALVRVSTAQLEDDLAGARAAEQARLAAEEAKRAAAAKKKAEEEALRKAEEEAHRAAEQAQQEQAQQEQSASGTSGTTAAVGGNSAGGAQAAAQSLAASDYGWGADQFSCLVSLWNRESGWNYQAYNAASGATGIPQALPGSKMASAGADWQTNATTQIV